MKAKACFLTSSEVANSLGVSCSQLNYYLQRGKGPRPIESPPGCRKFYAPEEVQRWRDERKAYHDSFVQSLREDKREAFTQRELAEILNISRDTLRRLKDPPPCLRAGGAPIYPRLDVIIWAKVQIEKYGGRNWFIEGIPRQRYDFQPKWAI